MPAVEPVKLNSQFTAIVQTICLIMIVALLAFAWVSPARVEESAEQQWEYMIQSVPYDVQFAETMTLYGLAGWELVFARRAVIRPSATERLRASRAGRELPDEPVYEIIFKRPARDTQATIDD